MTLVRYYPATLGNLACKMNRFANDYNHLSVAHSREFYPKMDISQDEKNFYFHLETPGMKKEDLKIKVTDDRILTISGEHKVENKKTLENILRTERRFGSFSRSFDLPETADTENVGAKFEKGVLEISIPKIEPKKPTEVEVALS